ncbi:MAG: exodeoxyribonuclease VII small subunit [Schaedlerella sp.]|nr:exodeoxyribonuclease VII small subunit [Schaedlerella sp.]
MTEKNLKNLEAEELKGQESLEDLFAELDNVATRMEELDVSLEESFQLYKQGMLLLKKCNETIDMVEKEVLILDESGDLYEF